MLILLHSTSFLVILEFPIEFQQTIDGGDDDDDIHTVLITTMWFFSRCISFDSLHTCFQQQKNKTSYDFRLCSGQSDVLANR